MKTPLLIFTFLVTFTFAFGQQQNNKYDDTWIKSPYVDTLLFNLSKCYECGIDMELHTGDAFEFSIQKGKHYYNQACENYKKLQLISNYSIPKAKRQTIDAALKFYADLFNDILAEGIFNQELKQTNANITGWPNSVSQEEEDLNDNIFRVVMEKDSKRLIGLPNIGKWCLWEMQGGDEIWLEGNLGGQNGKGIFDIHSRQLPLYLGNEKEFKVTNVTPFQSVTLIFKHCNKE